MITIDSIKKTILLAGGLFLSILSVNADNNSSGLTIDKLLPQFARMTPEAASLGKYGAFQVSEYSGAANISIPLYTVKSGDVSFPITLYYDATGIKVEQDATMVGLGWNLSYGGMISHIICGRDDFYETITYNKYWLNYWTGKNRSVVRDQPCAWLEQIISPIQTLMGVRGPMHEDEYELFDKMSKGGDSPDVFQASFCGHNLSFVIDKRTGKDSIIVLNNDSRKYKISYKTQAIWDKYPSSFTITDDKGINYYFEAYCEIYNFDEPAEIKDSYYLTKIYGPDGEKGKSVVSFYYDRSTIMGDDAEGNLSRSMFKNHSPSARLLEKNMELDLANKDKIFSEQYQKLISNHLESLPHKSGAGRGETLVPIACDEHGYCHKVYPKYIVTASDSIEFKKGKRFDLNGAKEIDCIIIHSKIGNAKKYVNFKYGYFSETPTNEKYRGAFAHKRLRLENVTIDAQKYAFEYRDSILPSVASYSKDYWGYYNGANPDDDIFVGCSPAYTISNGIVKPVVHLEGSNRLASEKLCNVGMLRKVTYPTGGYTLYEFEANRFNDQYYYPDASRKVSFPPASTPYNDYDVYLYGHYGPKTQTKTLTASQSDYKMKVGAQLMGASDAFTVTVKNSSGSVVETLNYKGSKQLDENISLSLTKGTSYTIEMKLTAVTNNSSTAAQCSVSHDVVNTNITASPTTKNEKGGYSIGGGLRIKTIKNYDSDKTYLNGVEYEYFGGKLLSPTVQLETHYVDFSFQHIDRPVIGYNPDKGEPIYGSGGSTVKPKPKFSFYYANTEPSYPYYCSLGIPATVGYDKVVKKEVDKSGKVLRKTILDYHNYGYITNDNNTNVINSRMQTAFYFNSYYNNDPHKGQLNGKLKKDSVFTGTTLTSTTQYEYKSDRLGSVMYPKCIPLHFAGGIIYDAAIYDLTFYRRFYAWSYLTSKTETLYDKNGNKTTSNTTSFQYNPTNYQLSDQSVTDGTNTSRTLYSYPASNTSRFKKHILSEVDGVETYRNGTFTGGSKYTYTTHKNPQTGVSFPVVQKCNSVLPNASKSNVTEMTVTSYDDYGNIREYKKKDGTPVTIIWSYNHQLPIMEIVGKTYDQVKAAYSSITSLEGKPSVAETTMSSIHATLRKSLPDALVTAYTYSPWQSVSQIIKPNGEKTVYSYDSYGRLTTVLDANQSTFQPIQMYNYNYKNK